MREPLLLLPAMMSDARMFQPQIAVLSRTHPVMVCPLVGAERIEDLASQILSVAPPRFALAGSDFGAMVAMEMIRRASDRVSRLALLSTTPLPESPQIAAAREPLMVAARAGRLSAVMDQIVPGSAFAMGDRRVKAHLLMHRMATDLGAGVFVAQMRALQRRRDQQATLRKVKQPALVLCGAQQDVYPVKRHRFMAELIPAGACEVIEQAGHWPTLEAPDETTAALQRWLAR